MKGPKMVHPDMSRETFKKVLLEAVNNGLLVLGESPREAIYYHLEKKGWVRKEEIPEKIEKFTEGLEGIFGPGSRIIERCIVKDLYAQLGLDFEERENFGFADYVQHALKLLMAKEAEKSKMLRADVERAK